MAESSEYTRRTGTLESPVKERDNKIISLESQIKSLKKIVNEDLNRKLEANSAQCDAILVRLDDLEDELHSDHSKKSTDEEKDDEEEEKEDKSEDEEKDDKPSDDGGKHDDDQGGAPGALSFISEERASKEGPSEPTQQGESASSSAKEKGSPAEDAPTQGESLNFNQALVLFNAGTSDQSSERQSEA